jgi:hypothetical protein
MTKQCQLRFHFTIGVATTFILHSCVYDPNYTNTRVTSSYRSEGYSNPSVSRSVFISTGNPRWGYDPQCYSYYDYNRRAYYDPYLNGYYPTGYRPPVVYGISHPHGWRPGVAYCQPPSRVTNVTIRNYQDRESSYRNYGYIRSTSIHNSQRHNHYAEPPAPYYRQNSRYPSRQIHQENRYIQPQRSFPDHNHSQGNIPNHRYPAQYNKPVKTNKLKTHLQNQAISQNPQYQPQQQPYVTGQPHEKIRREIQPR